MIHFVRTGGLIAERHLDVLIEHFAARGIEHRVRHDHDVASWARRGDACITCDMLLDRTFDAVRGRVFQVQLPHNLTGLKGSDFGSSRADLNVLASPHQRATQGIDAYDPRFVIGGYAKWDQIVGERHKVERRRGQVAASRGFDPALFWVLFYPTGPNRHFPGTHDQIEALRARAQSDLGDHEFIVCDHARNVAKPESRRALRIARQSSREDRHLHVIEGGSALPFVTTCDLFLSDVASTIVTRLSVGRPLLFVRCPCSENAAPHVARFQVGPFVDEVEHLGRYLKTYRQPEAQRRLFEALVVYDDERNCERITSIVLERYARWSPREGDVAEALTS